MKSNYPFGYLFVRFSKALGLLILGVGLLAAAVTSYQGTLQIESSRYQQNTALAQSLEKVKRTLAKTQSLVLAFHHATSFPAAQASASYLPEFQVSITSAHGFEQVDTALASTESANVALKRYLTGQFDARIDLIREKLLAYARKVEAEAGAGAPPALNHPPAQPPPPAPNRDVETLFARMDRTAQTERKQILDLGVEFVSALRGAAENPENQQKLGEVVEELQSFSRLLPLPKIDSPASKPADAAAPTPQKQLLTAEKVAGQLDEMKREVHQAIAAGWALDGALEEARQHWSAEAERLRVAQLAVRGLWVHLLSYAAAEIALGAFAGFLLLVFADLIKSLLDTASYTGLLADQYQS